MRAAFSLTPEYLKTAETGSVSNLMDTGIQLGRRFRALKLWMVLRHFGADGLRQRLAEHIRLARLFAGWVDRRATSSNGQHPRHLASSASAPGEHRRASTTALLDRLNATGEVFLSHTRLNGRFTLRLAIGNIHTTEQHVARAWTLIRRSSADLRDQMS